MTDQHGNAALASEIGNVLASIRDLISQEDGRPDFSDPVPRTDTQGRQRTALPLGPRSERIRSVIERELGNLSQQDGRLILADEARVDAASDGPADEDGYYPELGHASATDAQQDHPEAGTVELWLDNTGPAPEAADAIRHRQDVAEGLGRSDVSASITPISPHLPEPTADSTKKDPNMLAEKITRYESQTAEATQSGAFDLFAQNEVEEDDQLSGGSALRNLVRDVIRQELQGEMGDRISRNLRRAIRQEVASAIAAGLKVG